MLVLSRYPGQRIIIGEGDIQITVVSISDDGKVKLGFDCSTDIAINRSEIYDQLPSGKKDSIVKRKRNKR